MATSISSWAAGIGNRYAGATHRASSACHISAEMTSKGNTVFGAGNRRRARPPQRKAEALASANMH